MASNCAEYRQLQNAYNALEENSKKQETRIQLLENTQRILCAEVQEHSRQMEIVKKKQEQEYKRLQSNLNAAKRELSKSIESKSAQ